MSNNIFVTIIVSNNYHIVTYCFRNDENVVGLLSNPRYCQGNRAKYPAVDPSIILTGYPTTCYNKVRLFFQINTY